MERDIPGWALVSAGAAPVLLIGGWTLAGSRQPAGYDPVRDTISALAAHGAADRWVMTAALAGLGTCHLVTAAGLRPARRPGRLVLALGGLATVAVAALPQSTQGESDPHAVAASVAFLALAVWPWLAAGGAAGTPALLRPLAGRIAGAVLLGLVAWFALEDGRPLRGLAERAAAGAQALWPLAVAVTARWAGRRG